MILHNNKEWDKARVGIGQIKDLWMAELKPAKSVLKESRNKMYFNIQMILQEDDEP